MYVICESRLQVCAQYVRPVKTADRIWDSLVICMRVRVCGLYSYSPAVDVETSGSVNRAVQPSICMIAKNYPKREKLYLGSTHTIKSCEIASFFSIVCPKFFLQTLKHGGNNDGLDAL